MNSNKQAKINEAMNYVRLGNRGHINCIRLNSSCSDPHNIKIIELCSEYLRMGIPFVTECIFKDGSRCDILLPATFEIIEVMVTETEERFKEKHYPGVFDVRKVKVTA